MADRHGPITEVGDGRAHLMLGFAQCGDRTIHLARIGAVAQRVGTQMCGVLGHRFGDLGGTVDLGPAECRCSENMVKVVVCQHYD